MMNPNHGLNHHLGPHGPHDPLGQGHHPTQMIHPSMHPMQQHQYHAQQFQQHHQHYQMQQHSRRRQLQVLSFIRRFGKRAGFPIPTLAAAQLLFHITTLHGMHASVSQAQAQVTGQSLLAQAPLLDAACACLLVAGKAMDTAKKLRDLLTRAYAYHHRGEQQIDPDSERFSRWRAKIVLLEREVLESIQFRYNLPLPFDFLIRSCKKAACPKPLAFRAYQLLFDLYQCKVVVEYPPHILALTAVFLATRTFHVTDGHVASEELASPTSATNSPPDGSSSSVGPSGSALASASSAHSSLLTPASPEDVSLTLLPQSLRDVLDSFNDHVHAAALMALDFLIPMTPTESPLYEAYRSIKIELNQVLGIGAAAAAAAALAMPSPPPPAPFGLPAVGLDDEPPVAGVLEPGSPAHDNDGQYERRDAGGFCGPPRSMPFASHHGDGPGASRGHGGSNTSYPSTTSYRPAPSSSSSGPDRSAGFVQDRRAPAADYRRDKHRGGDRAPSSSSADMIVVHDLRSPPPPPSSSFARSDRGGATSGRDSASKHRAPAASPGRADPHPGHSSATTSPSRAARRGSAASTGGGGGRQYRPVGDAFHSHAQGQQAPPRGHEGGSGGGRDRDVYRDRERERDRDRHRDRGERDGGRERERERGGGDKRDGPGPNGGGSKRARRTSGASMGGGGEHHHHRR